MDSLYWRLWENALAIDLGETSRVILQSNVHGWISLCTNMAPHARALSRQTEQVDPLETVIDFQTQFYSHSGKFRSITGTLPCCSNGYGFELYSPSLMAHSCNFSEAPCGVTWTGKQTQTSESKDSELRLTPRGWEERRLWQNFRWYRWKMSIILTLCPKSGVECWMFLLRSWLCASWPGLGFVKPGLREQGCKLAFSGRKTQMLTLIHANLASQIPGLIMAEEMKIECFWVF